MTDLQKIKMVSLDNRCLVKSCGYFPMDSYMDMQAKENRALLICPRCGKTRWKELKYNHWQRVKLSNAL